jgi:hypothetical protein
MKMDIDMNYRPTPHLTDADGNRLLRDLSELYIATMRGENDKELKMPRSNADYWEIRRAATQLRKAILDAADQFPDHASFSTWLAQNHCEHIEAYDPLRMQDDMVAAIRDLRWRMAHMEQYVRSLNVLLIKAFASNERVELPTPPPVGTAEFFRGEAEHTTE